MLAVAKATGFEDAGRKINKLADDSKRHVSALTALATALTPAVIPIGAAAVAAGASLGALGATGLLAFEGIKKEMAAGTPTGKAYSATLGVLKADLAGLERTAAGGVLTGFQSSVKSLQPLMPLINRDTAQLSGKLGDIASHVMPGLVSLFHTANPLFLQFADDIDKGAASFERWATSSTGATKFVAYAQAQLPKVEHTLGDLATTVGHVAQGVAPLGGVALGSIGAFSKVINALPIPVLKVAAPAIVATVLAIKAMEVAALIAPKVNLLSGSLKGLAYANAIAGGSSMTALIGGLGKLSGAAIVATAGIYGAAQVAQDKLGPDAGRAAAIADEALKLVAGSVHQTTDQVVKGVSGTDAAFNTYVGSLGKISKFSNDSLNNLHDKLGKASAAVNGFGFAAGTLAGSQIKAGIVIDGVTTAIEKQTTAAGLWKTALDRLNGAAVSVEDTQNNFLDSLGQLKKAHDAGTRSISQNSAAGRANREVLVSAIKAASDHAQAVADQTAKTRGLSAGVKAGSADFKAHEDAIKRAAHAAGLDDAAVAALIAKLGKIPKTVVTKIGIHDSASAQLKTIKANIAALKSKQIDITTYIKNVVLPTVRTPSGSHDSRIRDFGGPVIKGEPYLIGLNKRPEIFIPGASGQIRPIASSSYVSPRAAGGSAPPIIINVYGSVLSNEDLKRAMAKGLAEWAAQGHTLPIARAIR